MKTSRIVSAFLGALFLLVGLPVAAFKPGPPPKQLRYVDSKTKAALVISNKGWRPSSYEVRVGRKRYRWPKPPSLPATARISSRAERVVLLGGYGDGCIDLGKVSLYTLAGKHVTSIDLKKHIAGLEKTSRAYTRICCPCRWLHKSTVSADGKTLELNVCDKHRVQIALKSGKLSLVK